MHTLSHIYFDNELPHCELCDFVNQTNQGTPLQPISDEGSLCLEKPVERSIPKSAFLYRAPDQKIQHSDYFHNKPPPPCFRG